MDDPRFKWDEIEQALDIVMDFYRECGHNINFILRRGLYEPLRGYNLHFAVPNGSHAKGRITNITYNDWVNYSHLRPNLIIHELNHTIFGCPDHYKGASFYEPCSEPCIMHSLEEGTLCSHCLEKVRSEKLSLFPVVASIVAFTAPLWFPILLDRLSGKNKNH